MPKMRPEFSFGWSFASSVSIWQKRLERESLSCSLLVDWFSKWLISRDIQRYPSNIFIHILPITTALIYIYAWHFYAKLPQYWSNALHWNQTCDYCIARVMLYCYFHHFVVKDVFLKNYSLKVGLIKQTDEFEITLWQRCWGGIVYRIHQVLLPPLSDYFLEYQSCQTYWEQTNERLAGRGSLTEGQTQEIYITNLPQTKAYYIIFLTSIGAKTKNKEMPK